MKAFNLLEQHGVIFQDSAAPLLHSEENKIATQDFFAEASELLRVLEPIVQSEVIENLEQFEGRWHPSGFMVYPLGVHPQLGTLRFHVWPKSMRKRLIKGRGDMGYIYDGDIHNHAWNIASLSMAYYQDYIFNVENTNLEVISDAEVNATTDHFRVFNVSYDKDVRQALMTSGRSVVARAQEKREAHKGEIHTIEVGVFHAPTVPEDTLGSTLVFDSFRLSDGPDVLIGGSADPVYDRRRPITREEALEVKAQFHAA